MSERASALAERFERENEQFIAAVEALSDAEWRSRCEAEGWSVGVAARHVASSHALIAGWVRARDRFGPVAEGIVPVAGS